MPTFQDLAGFWDLLQLSIEDVSMKFAELQQLKANGWKPIEAKVKKKKEEGDGIKLYKKPPTLCPYSFADPTGSCQSDESKFASEISVQVEKSWVDCGYVRGNEQVRVKVLACI